MNHELSDRVRRFGSLQSMMNTDYRASSSTIIFPREFVPQIEKLLEKQHETRGFMVARPHKGEKYTTYIVECVCILGEGDAYSVFPDRNKFEAASRLLLENTDVHGIDFHTHVPSTGVTFYDRFSYGDFSAFETCIDRYKNYKHVLFTPEHTLTFGNEKPSIQIPKNEHSLNRDNEKIWEDKFATILRSIIDNG